MVYTKHSMTVGILSLKAVAYVGSSSLGFGTELLCSMSEMCVLSDCPFSHSLED